MDVTREELAVLLPAITAMWEIRISGEKPLSPQKQNELGKRLATIWCRFLSENRHEWDSLGLTWDSFYLTTGIIHKGGPVDPVSLHR